jgi:hypothetical protein
MRRVLLCLAAVACAAVATGAPAWGAATLTSPTNGETLKLPKNMNMTFTWTLPADEVNPSVYVGPTPKVAQDAANGGGADLTCGGDVPVATSCTIPADGADTIVEGTYYAVVVTGNSDFADFPDPIVSPLTRFIIPTVLGWGCTPVGETACPVLKLQNFYKKFGDSVYPFAYTWMVAHAYSNTLSEQWTFTFRHGSRVVARYKKAGSEIGETQFEDGVALYRIRGLKPGTRLRCTIQVVAGTKTLTRTVTAYSGAGPKTGAGLLH